MKQGFELPQNKSIPPKIDIVESGVTSKNNKITERSLSSISDDLVNNPDEMDRAKYNEAFESAFKFIVGNKDLEKLAVRGFIEEVGGISFAKLMNKLTEFSVSLTDTEIDNIIGGFKRGIITRASQLGTEMKLTGDQLKRVQNGLISERNPHGSIDSMGIKSVVSFIRTRKKLHKLKPETIPSFYFEDYLDARHKIDLFEAIEGSEGTILNLIQVKSRNYTPEEIEKSIQAHKNWIDGFTVDLKTYENNYSREPKDSARYREFIGNKDTLDNLFFEILTGESVITKERFYRIIRLEGRAKPEKFWILREYLPAMKNEVEELMTGGILDGKTYKTAQALLSDIDTELQNMLTYKNNLTGIAEVHSITTVAEKIVNDEIIFSATDDDRKAIKIKH